MNLRFLFASMLTFVALSSATAGEFLYATSTPTGLAGGSATLAGNLYRVEPATAAFSLAGPMRVGGREPIGVTGLADHPLTGALYGVTSSGSSTHPNSLVTIDLSNGDATLIGKLGAAASDIEFDRGGMLFAWLRESSQMATADLSTELARRLGRAGSAGEPGGIVIDLSPEVHDAS